MSRMNGRGRFPLWSYGAAALVSVLAVLFAAGGVALRAVSDDDVAAAGGRGVAAPVSASPSADSTGARRPPSSLHEIAAQRRERAEKRATDAASASRAGGDAGADGASAPEVTARDVAAARGWLDAALAWREHEAANGAWGLAVERANAEWATPDVSVTVVPNTALENIASDAAVHGALPRIAEITDETDPEWAAAGEVTLRAAVVFGAGDGWTRPGLRLLAAFQVEGGKVAAVFIDDGYVVSDPGLLP